MKKILLITLICIAAATFLISPFMVNAGTCCANTYTTPGILRISMDGACCTSNPCPYYAHCHQYNEGTDFPIGSEGGNIKECYGCVQFCEPEGTLGSCTKTSDCCAKNGLGEDLYCDTAAGICCPEGSSYDSTLKKCEAHDPCYDITCTSSPGSSAWWGNSACWRLSSSPHQACCNVGTQYGMQWYDWETIATY